MKKVLIAFLLIFSNACLAQEITLEQDKSYVIFLDENVINARNINKNVFETSKVFNIFNEDSQILINTKKTGIDILKIITDNEKIEYTIRVSKKSENIPENFTEIDFPAIPFILDKPNLKEGL